MNVKWMAAAAAGAVAAVLLSVGVAGAAPAAPATIDSSTQAGYVAVPKAGGTVTSFKIAQATFTVPQLNCGGAAGNRTAQEVVVGGNALQAVAICDATGNAFQIYSVSTCVGERNQFVIIFPGDTIKLAVNAVTGQETVTDLTTQQTFTDGNAVACGAGSSAGVLTIAAPSAQNVTNFVQVGFHNIQVEGSNQTKLAALGSTAWTTKKYQLRGPSSHLDVVPEGLLTGTLTSAFVTDWRAPN
jgi:hypothetical protein